MKGTRTLLLRLELIWLLITAVVAATIVGPILYRLPEYQFLWPNLVFILVMITFTRYIFQLRYSFIADWRIFKAGLIFVCLWVAFFMVQEINGFQTFLDENGPEAVVGSLPREDQSAMMTYIRSEMLLFGVGAVISCGVLPLRLVVSLWRRWNCYDD